VILVLYPPGRFGGRARSRLRAASAFYTAKLDYDLTCWYLNLRRVMELVGNLGASKHPRIWEMRICTIYWGNIMSDERVEEGKRWIKQIFEQIKEEYKNMVDIKRWNSSWNAVSNTYHIRIFMEGRDDIDISFGRGKVADCGSHNPANDSVRRSVEARIRSKFKSLGRQE
jgi:hypothetical protein